jgi:hypothetical protein
MVPVSARADEEVPMATLIVKHRVADFDTWKAVFDGMNGTRAAYGWTGHLVLRDAHDPNVVTIVNRAANLDRAKAYAASPELRAAMARAGVQGPPEITFHDDADERAY